MTDDQKEMQKRLETNYKEHQAEFEKAKDRLEQFNKEMVEAEKHRTRKKEPKQFEYYFRINADGNVEHTAYDSEYDAMVINLGNYGSSAEDCKAIKERRRVNELLERYAKESGEVLWSNEEDTKTKYTFYYDYDDQSLCIQDVKWGRFNNAIYFNSVEMLTKAINEIGAVRIISALFQAE